MRVTLTGILLVGILSSGAAHAGRWHHHHGARVHFGLFIGAPLFYPPLFYPPLFYPQYYYPRAPVYVERADTSAQPSGQNGWWYYCEQPRGYYPYVKSCFGGWQKVPPAPPPAGR